MGGGGEEEGEGRDELSVLFYLRSIHTSPPKIPFDPTNKGFFFFV